MVKRWFTVVLLCLLARGWALAHAAAPAPPALRVAAIACVDAAAHAAPRDDPVGHAVPQPAHARHPDNANQDAPSAEDGHGAPDCRIVCELGHAPVLASLWWPLPAPDWPAVRPLGWRPLNGVVPWPPELPPPARG